MQDYTTARLPPIGATVASHRPCLRWWSPRKHV